ncbi:hypothetical protein GWK36_02550 [Caldichromatium japonicum]|uniref:Mth938-like domain-containing protein n=2 Tax=Caldichromatium japonicum TaxID=2699430 RepID=A0A6G7VG97_9GAMM|nr:hypothetical protein GWK36_02550 [Caldichromatium japonicum]
MKFAEIEQTEGHLVEAHGPGWVRISGQRYTQGLILTPAEIVSPWGPACASELDLEHLLDLTRFAPEVILIGTGQTTALLDPLLQAPFIQQRIGVEWMTTAAACRTYNILVAEGRRVVAALIID